MRVADKMNYNHALAAITKNRQEMLVQQNQAATQKRINKPSDDPIGSARILEARTEMAGFDQYKKNILSAKEFVEFSESSLGQMNELLIRAKELAIDQADDGANGAESRAIVAKEIRQIYEQIVNIANRRFGDRYLFGGYNTMQTPFDMSGTYYGDDSEIEVQIDKGSYIKMNVPGSTVFLGQKVKPPMTHQQEQQLQENGFIETRGPASVESSIATQTLAQSSSGHWGNKSVNLFETLRDLEVGLNANDKRVVQNSLDYLDGALSQVNQARGELGSRMTALNAGLETLQKMNVDKKIIQSEIEDVDMYELVNNLSKTQNQLEASLATSSKMVKTSLLDFLR